MRAIAINHSVFIHYSVKSQQKLCHDKGRDETVGKNPKPPPVGWRGEKERERQRDRDREIRTNRDNNNKISQTVAASELELMCINSDSAIMKPSIEN